MKVLITGAAGFLGTKLTSTLLSEKEIGGQKVTDLVLIDIEKNEGIPDDPPFPIKVVRTDLPLGIDTLLKNRPDVIFHLASMPWKDAENNFDEGMYTNIDLTRILLDEIRAIDGYKPRLVYASSLFPSKMSDDCFCTATITAHRICELLIDEYSRRGFVDGISIRLPTITIRPLFRNKMPTDIFSRLIVGPLHGIEVVCPASLNMRRDVASPRSAVKFLLRGAIVPSDKLSKGLTRAITMPSLSVSIGHVIEALILVTGKGAFHLIKMELDPSNEEAVFPTSKIEPKLAKELGFILCERSFDDIVSAYIYDDIGGNRYSLRHRSIGMEHAPGPKRMVQTHGLSA